MMIRALTSAAAFVVTLAFVYLVGAFFEWKVSPGDWDTGTRIVMAMIGIPTAAGIATFAHEFIQ